MHSIVYYYYIHRILAKFLIFVGIKKQKTMSEPAPLGAGKKR